MAENENGQVISSITSLTEGELVKLNLSDGFVKARVEEIYPLIPEREEN